MGWLGIVLPSLSLSVWNWGTVNADHWKFADFKLRVCVWLGVSHAYWGSGPFPRSGPLKAHGPVPSHCSHPHQYGPEKTMHEFTTDRSILNILICYYCYDSQDWLFRYGDDIVSVCDTALSNVYIFRQSSVSCMQPDFGEIHSIMCTYVHSEDDENCQVFQFTLEARLRMTDIREKMMES